jgi:molybdenum cofactor cytidylyltransferase
MSPQVSAILLAAGLSRRMGQPKQIMSFNGKAFVSHCLDHIFACGIGDVVVVLGAHRDQVVPLLAERPVRLVFNHAIGSEMVDSVRLGLFAVTQSATGVLVCLSDHPLVAPETYRRLVDVHSLSPEKILIPTYRGKRGHPGLFPKVIIDTVRDGFHLRQIIDQNAGAVLNVPVCDSGILFDIDTMADYEKACRQKPRATSYGESARLRGSIKRAGMNPAPT